MVFDNLSEKLVRVVYVFSVGTGRHNPARMKVLFDCIWGDDYFIFFKNGLGKLKATPAVMQAMSHDQSIFFFGQWTESSPRKQACTTIKSKLRLNFDNIFKQFHKMLFG